MAIKLSEEQQAVLAETAAVSTPQDFNHLCAIAEPETNRAVREVMEPNQAIDTTKIELRDLYLAVVEQAPKLVQVHYGPERSAAFRDAIRLLETAALWFGEGQRKGVYKPRTVEEVVQASRPWRARIAAIAGHAFVFEPDIADQFSDVNSSGTIVKEKDDLMTMNALFGQHQARLSEFGLTPELVTEGKTLLEEAEGRDLAGILGVRYQEDAI